MLRLWVSVERKKLPSACHTARPMFCQPPKYVAVNCVSTCQLLPSWARSWWMKLIGPTDVAAAASISRSFVGRRSWPAPVSVGASGPVVGVPPLRVCRCQRGSRSLPSNSSDRSQTGSWTLNVTDLIASVLAALSPERNSTRCVPLLETVSSFANGLAPAVLSFLTQSPATPLVVTRYSVYSTPDALGVPASVADRLTLTERLYVSPVAGAAGSSVAVVVGASVSQVTGSGVTRK